MGAVQLGEWVAQAQQDGRVPVGQVVNWCRAPRPDGMDQHIVVAGDVLASIAAAAYPLRCLACHSEHPINTLHDDPYDLLKDVSCPTCGTVGLWPTTRPVEEVEWADKRLWDEFGPSGALPAGEVVWLPRLCGHPVTQIHPKGKQPQYGGRECPGGHQNWFDHVGARADRLRSRALSNKTGERSPGRARKVSDPTPEPVTVVEQDEVAAQLSASIAATTTDVAAVEPSPKPAQSESPANADVVPEGAADDEDVEADQEVGPADLVRPAQQLLAEVARSLHSAAQNTLDMRKQLHTAATGFTALMEEMQSKLAEADDRVRQANEASQAAAAKVERIEVEAEAQVAEARQSEQEAVARAQEARGAAEVLERRLAAMETELRQTRGKLDEVRDQHQRKLDEVREKHQNELRAQERAYQQKLERVYEQALANQRPQSSGYWRGEEESGRSRPHRLSKPQQKMLSEILGESADSGVSGHSRVTQAIGSSGEESVWYIEGRPAEDGAITTLDALARHGFVACDVVGQDGIADVYVTEAGKAALEAQRSAKESQPPAEGAVQEMLTRVKRGIVSRQPGKAGELVWHTGVNEPAFRPAAATLNWLLDHGRIRVGKDGVAVFVG